MYMNMYVVYLLKCTVDMFEVDVQTFANTIHTCTFFCRLHIVGFPKYLHCWRHVAGDKKFYLSLVKIKIYIYECASLTFCSSAHHWW